MSTHASLALGDEQEVGSYLYRVRDTNRGVPGLDLRDESGRPLRAQEEVEQVGALSEKRDQGLVGGA